MSCNTSSIDLASSVKMARYWPRSLFASGSIKTEKRKLGQYPGIVTSRMVNDIYIHR